MGGVSRINFDEGKTGLFSLTWIALIGIPLIFSISALTSAVVQKNIAQKHNVTKSRALFHVTHGQAAMCNTQMTQPWRCCCSPVALDIARRPLGPKIRRASRPKAAVGNDRVGTLADGTRSNAWRLRRSRDLLKACKKKHLSVVVRCTIAAPSLVQRIPT